MTAQREFKQQVRNRMAKTGERYTAARATILQSLRSPEASPPKSPGLFDGYLPAPGICCDTGATRNVLAQSALHPDGNALTEAMIYGLCGGVGFLYAVFEYKGLPPLLSVLMRYDTMADTFVAGGLARLGQAIQVRQTASAAKARKLLDELIERGVPALCTIDLVTLAGEANPGEIAGGAPGVVAVAGVDDGELILDDGYKLRRMNANRFGKARAAYKKGQNRLIFVDPSAAPPTRKALCDAAVEAVRDTARRYTESPYKGFASNMGLAGIAKWRRLLTDPKDAKGWPRLFPGGTRACTALRRTFEGLEHEYTAPAGGRFIYSDFLGEVGKLTRRTAFDRASEAYRRAGQAWRAMSDAIASCGIPVVQSGCAHLDRYMEMLDASRSESRAEGPKLSRTEDAAAANDVTPEQAKAVFATLAELLADVEQAETAAHRALLDAAGD